MPTQRSLQFTGAMDRQVDTLKARGFGNRTDIVRIAIDRMHREEREKDCTIDTPFGPTIDLQRKAELGD